MTDTLNVVSAVLPAPEEPHAGSFPRRVMDTFFSPVALFSASAHGRPGWT